MTARKPRVGDVWRGVLHRESIAYRYFRPGDGFAFLSRAEQEIVDWPSLWEFVGRVVPPDHPGVDALRLLLPMLSVAPSSLWQPEEQAALDALASLLALIEGDPDDQ